MGQEGDCEEVDKAWSETGRWAKEVAQFKHAKIQAIRLGDDPNAPGLPENMTLDELRGRGARQKRREHLLPEMERRVAASLRLATR